jgi:uncharacterized membrane protein
VKARGRRHAGAGAARTVHVEGLIARLLLGGGLLSVALVLLGLVLYAAHGGFAGDTLEVHRIVRPDRGAHPADVFVSFSEVVGGLTARPIDARAVIALGLAFLLMTPVLGVAAAIPGFLAAGDYQYATIATVVLAMLVLSILFAGAAG